MVGQHLSKSPRATPIKNRKAKVDKTAIANEVMARWTDATGWPLDLRQQVQNVADLVREANDV